MIVFIISVELPQNLLKSAVESMKYFCGILENLPRKTGGTDIWLNHLHSHV